MAGRVETLGETKTSLVAGAAGEQRGDRSWTRRRRVGGHWRGSGLGSRPPGRVVFRDNYASPWILPELRAGVLAQPMPATTRQQIVAVRDIGEIVARAIEAPARAAG